MWPLSVDPSQNKWRDLTRCPWQVGGWEGPAILLKFPENATVDLIGYDGRDPMNSANLFIRRAQNMLKILLDEALT